MTDETIRKIDGYCDRAINQNLPEIIAKFSSTGPKVFATEYIDDRMCMKFKLPYVATANE